MALYRVTDDSMPEGEEVVHCTTEFAYAYELAKARGLGSEGVVRLEDGMDGNNFPDGTPCRMRREGRVLAEFNSTKGIDDE